MKECHVCLFLCEDDAELCPVCGAELLVEPEEEPEKEPENESPATNEAPENLILAASADSPVTAEIFKDILAENGIAYSVDEQGDMMRSGFGGSYFAIDIYVGEKDVELAKELYRNLVESDMGFEDFEDFDGSEDGEV